MDQATATAISQGINALLQIWRQNSNKPPEWIPSKAEWDAMLLLNEKSAEDYKAEAARLLGLPWPPPA